MNGQNLDKENIEVLINDLRAKLLETYKGFDSISEEVVYSNEYKIDFSTLKIVKHKEKDSVLQWSIYASDNGQKINRASLAIRGRIRFEFEFLHSDRYVFIIVWSGGGKYENRYNLGNGFLVYDKEYGRSSFITFALEYLVDVWIKDKILFGLENDTDASSIKKIFYVDAELNVKSKLVFADNNLIMGAKIAKDGMSEIISVPRSNKEYSLRIMSLHKIYKLLDHIDLYNSVDSSECFTLYGRQDYNEDNQPFLWEISHDIYINCIK
jgi:hypothetical protein